MGKLYEADAHHLVARSWSFTWANDQAGDRVDKQADEQAVERVDNTSAQRLHYDDVVFLWNTIFWLWWFPSYISNCPQGLTSSVAFHVIKQRDYRPLKQCPRFQIKRERPQFLFLDYPEVCLIGSFWQEKSFLLYFKTFNVRLSFVSLTFEGFFYDTQT